jgi:hypothetical protein
MQINHEILAAADDARYLLGRGYSREQVLKLTGDRYELGADQRNLIRRGVFGHKEAEARKNRRLTWDDLSGAVLGIDGHNVLITLETALKGGVLLLADDGWVRDIAELGRNHRPGPASYEAARLMVAGLEQAGAKGAHIFLDGPLPQSGDLAARLRANLALCGLSGDARAVPVPENYLKEHKGPVASSDSALIDAVEKPLDLAGMIITRSRHLGAPLKLENESTA